MIVNRNNDHEKIIIVALDVEHTGDSMSRNAVIELGMAVYSFATSSTLPIHIQEWKIKKEPGTVWDPVCLKEFWFDETRPEHEILMKKYKYAERGEGMELDKVMDEFTTVLHRLKRESKGEVFFITDTASADCSRINYLLDKCNYPPLHTFFGKYNDVVSTSSYARGASGVMYEDIVQTMREKKYFSSSKWFADKFGIRCLQNKHKHTAMGDAMFIGQEHFIHLNTIQNLELHSKVEAKDTTSSVDQNGQMIV